MRETCAAGKFVVSQRVVERAFSMRISANLELLLLLSTYMKSRVPFCIRIYIVAPSSIQD